MSLASNFGATDGENCGQPPFEPLHQCYDVYLRDLTTGTTSLVSVNAAGTDSGLRGDSGGPIIFSADGTKLVFTSGATDLLAGLSTYGTNVFVRDLVAGTTSLASMNAGGTDGGNGSSTGLGISPDGTQVLFESWSTNLGPADTNGFPDLYLRDLATGATSVLSGDAAGAVASDRGGTDGSFSADGTKVVFSSGSTDLGTVDTNPDIDIYVRDLATGAVTLASPNAAGTNGGNFHSFQPVLSPDGTQVLFTSYATDLGPPDTVMCHPELSCVDIYLRDLEAGTTTMVSVNAAGTNGANEDALAHAFSHDGTKVVFSTASSDVVPVDSNVCYEGTGSCVDVFVRDLVAGTTTLVSVDSTGADSANDHSIAGEFSWDDSLVVFRSLTTNLGPNDSNGWDDLYARNLATGTTSLVTARAGGDDAMNAGVSLTFALAPSDGRVMFWTRASDVVATDSNGSQDVFIATLP